MNTVVRVPSEIINNVNLGEKRIIFYLFLSFRRSMANEIVFNTSEAVTACGYKPNSCKGKINEEFKTFVSSLVDLGYLNEQKVSMHFSKYEPAKKFWDKPFVLVSYDEFVKIVQSGKIRIHSSLLLCHVRLYRHKRLKPNDNAPEIYFQHFSKIAERYNLPSRAISLAAYSLSNLDIMYSVESDCRKDKFGRFHAGQTVFVDRQKYLVDGSVDITYNWEQEMESALEYVGKRSLRFYMPDKEEFVGGDQVK